MFLRKDCAADGITADCFETMPELETWISSTRLPSAAAPLLVDIGPDQFGGFHCRNDNRAWVTLRGAGRERTILTSGPVGVDVVSCQSLEFMDMTIQGYEWAVRWESGGDSVWTDTDIVGVEDLNDPLNDAFAWADDICSNGEKALHYFFGSRIIQNGSIPGAYQIPTAYLAQCSEVWFYGGEITFNLTEGHVNPFGAVVMIGPSADFRAFGTAIRLVGNSNIDVGGLRGVDTGIFHYLDPGPGVFHMHGGIISITVPNAASPVVVNGIQIGGANPGSLVHTPGTAFALNTGAATPTRLTTDGSGKILSPFLWESGANPPHASSEANVLSSEDGQDVFVETDCSASGNCASGGSQPHMMLYAEQECGAANPWFDVVTGACRQ